ncbi:trypsin eta-like [Periplaneta americana]|uniref:trypsin eta-like n=1 Tax=Periplaneta americana TaxID=6978 RepID=UPI0037E8281A
MGVVTGWGKLKENGKALDVLQQVSLSVLNTDKCKKILQDRGFGIYNHDGQMCTLEDGKDVCQGDSGGPFAVDGKLVGVVSWGEGCGRQEMPGVYPAIPYFHRWVEDVTGIGSADRE